MNKLRIIDSVLSESIIKCSESFTKDFEFPDPLTLKKYISRIFNTDIVLWLLLHGSKIRPDWWRNNYGELVVTDLQLGEVSRHDTKTKYLGSAELHDNKTSTWNYHLNWKLKEFPIRSNSFMQFGIAESSYHLLVCDLIDRNKRYFSRVSFIYNFNLKMITESNFRGLKAK